jgi:(4S)-4-hydroxy-5-phosphonooxypentane-2,3-dione isomerase
MYVVAVEFELHEKRNSEFITLVRENAETSRRAELGCRKFDVCIDPTNPAYVFLYELYDDRAAFEDHLATDHFRSFDRASAPMFRSKKVRFLEHV